MRNSDKGFRRMRLATLTLAMSVLPVCELLEPPGPDLLPPDVSISQPNDRGIFATGEVIHFAGSARDETDGPLPAESIVWTSSLDGQIGTGSSIESSSLQSGVHTIRLTGTDEAGHTASEAVEITLYPPSYGGVNLQPVVTIDRPRFNDVFPLGETVVFEGRAIDPEEGPMDEDEMLWESRMDELGRGRRVTKPDFSAGRHRVQLRATDPYGVTDTDALYIWIFDPAEPCNTPISLDTSPSSIVPGGVATVNVHVVKSATAIAIVRLQDGPDQAVEDAAVAYSVDVEVAESDHVISIQARDDLSPGSRFTLRVTAYVEKGSVTACEVPLELVVVESVGYNTPPVPTIDRPADGGVFPEFERVAIVGSATDAQDGDLPSGALRWSSDIDGPLGLGHVVSRRNLSVGTHRITLTATDSGALSDSTSVTIEVTGSNSPPVPVIGAPADGSTFTSGQVIDFHGSATDPEDGALTGASLVWSSDRDGPLGNGETISRDDLSVGDHLITLTATDSDGSDASASVNLTVNSPATSTGTIAGSVIFAATPLADITVTLSGDAEATLLTTVLGQFLFTDLAAGTYTVTISNYPTYANFPFTSQTVTLADGERSTIIFRAP